MAELDEIIARLFSAAVDLAGQKIALEEGKPLKPIRRALNRCAEEHKRYCGAEVKQAVKIIEPEPTAGPAFPILSWCTRQAGFACLPRLPVLIRRVGIPDIRPVLLGVMRLRTKDGKHLNGSPKAYLDAGRLTAAAFHS